MYVFNLNSMIKYPSIQKSILCETDLSAYIFLSTFYYIIYFKVIYFTSSNTAVPSFNWFLQKIEFENVI